MELITGKRKIRYLVKTRGFKVGVDNCSHNNESDGNADDERNNNHEAKTVPPTQLDEVIAMIVDPRSPTGGPRPEVVVRPPNVPPPKHFIKFKKHFQPVKDDVEVLPLKEVKGEADEHNWWKAVVAGVIGVGCFYFLLAGYLSKDACPLEIPEKEKDDPMPMVGKYHTSLPVKMKDLQKAEVVMGRPQKDHIKSTSDIEKNWNTADPNAAHLRAGAGAAPAEGNARYGVANDEDDDEAGRGRGRGGSGASLDDEVGQEVKLRRDVNLRQNMRLELGKTGQCKEEKK